MNSEVYEVLKRTYDEIKAKKPNDRSDKDRYYAVILTDLEKTLAYAYLYLGVE